MGNGTSRFQKMAEDVAAVKKSMDEFENNGISKQLMVLYIHDKTRLPKQKINLILDAQKEFLDEAVEN